MSSACTVFWLLGVFLAFSVIKAKESGSDRLLNSEEDDGPTPNYYDYFVYDDELGFLNTTDPVPISPSSDSSSSPSPSSSPLPLTFLSILLCLFIFLLPTI